MFARDFGPAILFVYGLLLLITGKPIVTKRSRTGYANIYFKSTIWLRVAGALFIFMFILDRIIYKVFLSTEGVVWLFFPIPFVIFIIGLFKSAKGNIY